jgi:hypothetical protein
MIASARDSCCAKRMQPKLLSTHHPVLWQDFDSYA